MLQLNKISYFATKEKNIKTYTKGNSTSYFFSEPNGTMKTLILRFKETKFDIPLNAFTFTYT